MHQILDKLRHTRAAHWFAHRSHHLETGMHCTYLSAVGYEAHGLYSWAAIGLLVVVIGGHFFGGE